MPIGKTEGPAHAGEWFENRRKASAWVAEALDHLLPFHWRDDPNFQETPLRWVKFLQEFNLQYDPETVLGATFDAPVSNTYDHSMVVQPNIPLRAVCAHHLLPILGHAHVGYIPEAKVVGLSKLARHVYGVSHVAPSLQENICNTVTELMMKHLKPLGVMCVIAAEHGCMACRGVEEPGVKTVTSSVKGVFIDKIEAREEFYRLVNLGNS